MTFSQLGIKGFIFFQSYDISGLDEHSIFYDLPKSSWKRSGLVAQWLAHTAAPCQAVLGQCNPSQPACHCVAFFLEQLTKFL